MNLRMILSLVLPGLCVACGAAGGGSDSGASGLGHLTKTDDTTPTVVLPAESHNLVTVVGRDYEIGDGGPATSALLNLPGNAIADGAGNRYVSESGGHRIRRIDPAGTITTLAGTGGSGFNGDGIQATTAQLSTPRGMAFDPSGSLCFCEASGHRVRRIDLTTGIITTLAGTGIAGSTGDDGPATAARLNAPGYPVFDSSGSLYISEVNGNRIRKVDATGTITTLAGTGDAGSGGDGGPATAAQFRSPNGLTLDPDGNLYVADVNNHRVRRISLATGLITAFAGTGVTGFSPDGTPAMDAMLNTPRSVAADSLGNVYIAEFNSNRIRKVDPSGVLTTFAGTGVRDFWGDLGPATEARLNGPNGVSVDSLGNVYIGESLGHRVRRIDGTGIITTLAGGAVPVLGDGGPATWAQIDPAGGVALDSAANVYIADYVNNRVRRVDAETRLIATIAGTGVTGSVGDGGAATAAQLNGPFEVVRDAPGNLYVADSTGRRVRRIDTSGGITTFVGTGTSGSAGDGGLAAAAQVNNPQGLALDSSGNLYISEFGGHRVRKVDAVTGIITRIGGNGVPGFSGDGSPALGAGINTPQGIAVDAAGNLYIADVGNNRIRKVDVGGIITTFAGTGALGSAGDGGPATLADLNSPQHVAADAAGNVYISDTGNNRVRRVDTAGIITTIAGNGLSGFSGDGFAALAARLKGPRGVSFDSAGNLYITDGANSRIRRLNVAAEVRVNPDTLHAHAQGLWLTVYVQLPAGRDASDVALGSIRLQAIDPESGALRHASDASQLQVPVAPNAPSERIDTDGDGVEDQLMLKFDRASVASWVVGAADLVLRVEGQFEPPAGSGVGTYFSGDRRLPQGPHDR